MKKIASLSTIPTNPEAWSSSSKQSYLYELSPSEYSDRHYNCLRCKKPCVYTAEAQQEAYEIRKEYIWQKRKLCNNCYREKVEIEKSLSECRQLWQTEKSRLSTSAQFLTRWLGHLEAHVDYGGKLDQGNIKMIKALIEGLEI